MTPSKQTEPQPKTSGCLICGKDLRLVRGLCDVHYRRFLARCREIEKTAGAAAAEKFEADCLADGWITPKTRGGRKKDVDPFDRIADRVVREAKSGYLDDVQVDPDELEEVVREGEEVIRQEMARRNSGLPEQLRKRRKSG